MRTSSLNILLIFCFVFFNCSKQENNTLNFSQTSNSEGIELSKYNYSVNDLSYSAELGKLTVKENRENLNSRLISIPIVRIYATGSSPKEPIFYLSGGPGAPNVKSYQFVNDLIEGHDIVLVGYRGAEGTVVMNCPEVDIFFSKSNGDLADPITIDKMTKAYADCAKRLQEEGVDLDGYNIAHVIDDIEAARVALGYDKINFLSGSFGTRLAMIYGWMYPENVQHSAMISVNPPGHFVWYPEVLDDQLNYYSELCEKDSYCSGRTDDLAELIRKVSRRIPNRWGLFPIKKGNVLMGTFMMLYHTDTSAKIFDAWIDASNGDWSGMAMLSMSIDFMLKGAVIWGESAAKAMSSDYIFDENDNLIEKFNPENSIIGAPGSLPGIAGAAGWPANIITDSLRTALPSSVSTLMISGNIDFSTPARFARDELLPKFENGHQVILSEFGHTGDVWGKQRDALNHMLNTFYSTGNVDDSKFAYAPMNFDEGIGFGTMLKLGIVGIILIIVLIGLLIRYIIKRSAKRKIRMSNH